jgi:hypothetical protein
MENLFHQNEIEMDVDFSLYVVMKSFLMKCSEGSTTGSGLHDVVKEMEVELILEHSLLIW